jgi:hypothetical protein
VATSWYRQISRKQKRPGIASLFESRASRISRGTPDQKVTTPNRNDTQTHEETKHKYLFHRTNLLKATHLVLLKLPEPNLPVNRADKADKDATPLFTAARSFKCQHTENRLDPKPLRQWILARRSQIAINGWSE